MIGTQCAVPERETDTNTSYETREIARGDRGREGDEEEMSLARVIGHERAAEERRVELGLLCGGEDSGSAEGEGWRVDEDFERVEHLVVIGEEGFG